MILYSGHLSGVCSMWGHDLMVSVIYKTRAYSPFIQGKLSTERSPRWLCPRNQAVSIAFSAHLSNTYFWVQLSKIGPNSTQQSRHTSGIQENVNKWKRNQQNLFSYLQGKQNQQRDFLLARQIKSIMWFPTCKANKINNVVSYLQGKQNQ